MKTAKVKIHELHVSAGVLFWDDAKVNGVHDTEQGDNVPFKNGNRWEPVINVETGVIKNWDKGKTARIHYKVCDNGVYTLKDVDGNTIVSIKGYVPDCMCPKENGYGDYIIMNVDCDGKIDGWDPVFNEFDYK